jgi:hypothetical protein
VVDKQKEQLFASTLSSWQIFNVLLSRIRHFKKGNCIADGSISSTCGGVRCATLQCTIGAWLHRKRNGELDIKKQALLAIQPLLRELDHGAAALTKFITATYKLLDE